MRRIIFTFFLISQTLISFCAIIPSINSGGVESTYNKERFIILTGGNLGFCWGAHIGIKIYVDNTKIATSNGIYYIDTFVDCYGFNPASYFTDLGIHRISDEAGKIVPFFVGMQSPTINTVCSQSSHTIGLITTNTKRWEKSSNNGVSWDNISCTSAIYTESNPTAGIYLYRALNGDGTYSSIVQVTYQDAVPASILVSPASNTKTVDENITLTTNATDATFVYQWNKDGAAITGATRSLPSKAQMQEATLAPSAMAATASHRQLPLFRSTKQHK